MPPWCGRKVSLLYFVYYSKLGLKVKRLTTLDKCYNYRYKLILFMKLFKLREFGVLAALILMVIGLEAGSRLMHDRTFFDAYNIQRITRDFSFVGIAAIGAVIVIISGGVDLSAGSIMGLSAVTLASLYTMGKFSPLVSLAAALLVGALCGFVNGFFIGKVKVPPFIATLGMLSVAAGLSYLFTQGLNVNILWHDDPSSTVALFKMLGAYSFFFMIGAMIIVSLFMSRFKWGRYVYALGSNEECSRFSGLNIDWIKIAIYTAAGIFSALAGAAYALRYGYASTGTAKGYELQIIAACVVGGASFAGGQGSVFGTVLGACILQFLKEALILYNVKEEYVQIVYGLTIVIAVSIDQFRSQPLFEKIFGGRQA